VADSDPGIVGKLPVLLQTDAEEGMRMVAVIRA